MPRVRYKHNPQPTRDEMKIMIKQQLLQVTMLLNQLGEAYRHINDLKMLSLFFEKWKVKSKCFEIEIEKWKFSRILNHSRETRFFYRLVPWKPNKTAETNGLPWGNNHGHFHNLTILKSESSLTNLLYCRLISLLNLGDIFWKQNVSLS